MAGKSSTDVLTPEQRSYCMSRIRAKDTKPEVKLRKALWSLGYRYRIHYKLPGKPDIVFVGQRLVIFVDGCFWHKCPEHFQWPKSRSDFWFEKLQKNVLRDAEVNRKLSQDNWLVLRFWEHEVKSHLDEVVSTIVNKINDTR